MSGRTTTPYGGWPSTLPIELLVQGRVGLSEPRFDADGRTLAWLESRAEEGGRSVLVRWTDEDGLRDVSPPGLNVRTRVHEYGGAPALVAGDLVVVSDFATGRLHRVSVDRTSEPITPDGPFRYADFVLDAGRDRLVAVREDHTGPGEAEHAVAIPPTALRRQAGRWLTSRGARPSPDGTSLRSSPGITRTAGRDRAVRCPDPRRRRARRGAPGGRVGLGLDLAAALVADGRPALRRRAGRLDEPAPRRRR
jgi:hypothetical protein